MSLVETKLVVGGYYEKEQNKKQNTYDIIDVMCHDCHDASDCNSGSADRGCLSGSLNVAFRLQ